MREVGLYLEKEGFFEEIETVKTDEKADIRYKLVVIAFIVFCFLFIGEFVIYKYIKPSLSSPRVSISGQETITAEEIGMKLVAMNSNDWFSFDVDKAESILKSEPRIADAKVEKHFPDKIFIKITERVPVAITFVGENGKSQPLQIDEKGVLFTNERNSAATRNGIPIISGIPIEHMTDGMRIPQKYKPLIEQIAKIQSMPQQFFAAVSEICVVPKEYGNYELVLIPTTGHVRVLTDRALNEDALKYMMLVLDLIKQQSFDAEVVDLRYGSVSFRAF